MTSCSDVTSMSIKAMKEEIVCLGGSTDGCVQRADVVSRLLEARRLSENAMDEDEKQRQRRERGAAPPHTSRRAFSNCLERLGGLHQLRLREVWCACACACACVCVWVRAARVCLDTTVCVYAYAYYMCPHTTMSVSSS